MLLHHLPSPTQCFSALLLILLMAQSAAEIHRNTVRLLSRADTPFPIARGNTRDVRRASATRLRARRTTWKSLRSLPPHWRSRISSTSLTGFAWTRLMRMLPWVRAAPVVAGAAPPAARTPASLATAARALTVVHSWVVKYEKHGIIW